jgi:subtilisin-like proprotein convertase family protein
MARALSGWVRALACAAGVLSASAVVLGQGGQPAQGAVNAGGAVGGRVSADGLWRLVDAGAESSGTPNIRPARAQRLVLDLAGLTRMLEGAPRERLDGAEGAPLIVTLPDPDGGFQSFAVFEAPVMDDGLARQFPEIRTFAGYGLDDRHATLRADVTPWGFHAQVLTSRGHWLIDPWTRGETSEYSAYYKRDANGKLRRFSCAVPEMADAPPGANGAESGAGIFSGPSSGTELATFRLAVATTGEFTAFHGGTAALSQAAVVTIVNRVTGIFERELAVRLSLVANNQLLMFTDPATDPFTNDDVNELIFESHDTIVATIGSANFDIGHVFATSPGGLAAVASVCNANTKGRGASGISSPVGDPFAVDYVAHEIGHQFGARHTFNGTQGSCATNRAPLSAYEPGSGSTIMAYSGICGDDNLQIFADAMFHHQSIQEMRNPINAGTVSCGTRAATGNVLPVIDVFPANRAIPKGTPFTLSASATDSNGDALTYSWEQRDLGPAAALGTKDDGNIPLFRTYAPTASGERTFPRWDVILNSANLDDTGAEQLPTRGRTMDFRLSVRDNRVGGGGMVSRDVALTVVGNAGPFVVTSPNSAGTLSGAVTVNWSVNGTNLSPIGVTQVDILLSKDGGATFPVVLADGTANDGSEVVQLPDEAVTAARIMVRARTSIFFDVSDADFAIQPTPAGVALVGPVSVGIEDTTGTGNASGWADPGENDVAVLPVLRNQGATTGTGIQAVLESLSPTVLVTQANAGYPDLATNATAGPSSAFRINVLPGHTCGANINLRLTVSALGEAQPTVLEFSVPTGSPGASGAPVELTFSGEAPIPDNDPNGVVVQFNAAGVAELDSVQVRFNGSACSAAVGATTVGLDHTWIGDLRVTLTSPDGTVFRLMDRPGLPPLGSLGNNFCQTVLSDSGAYSIQNIPDIAPTDPLDTRTGPPYTGVWQPLDALLPLVGTNGNGLWVLRVADVAEIDTGTLRSVSLVLTPRGGRVCEPVVGAECLSDYNRDGGTNLDDLGDYLTDFYITPPIAGGFQPLAPTYPGIEVGFGQPCPLAPDADPALWVLGGVNAYREYGYRVGYSVDGSNACPIAPEAQFPNLDNLSDFITLYYAEFGTASCPIAAPE